MAYTMSCTKSLVFSCAFAALANCAKADIEYAQEHQGTGRVVVHDPEAKIGNGNEQFKTPWMIVSPDGSRGFTNDFTTNAFSVVTEDGTNYFAHIRGENNDRTKVIHFTVNKDGIPNSHGDVIDTTVTPPSETNTVENMKDSTLVGVSEGYLFFYSTVPYPLGDSYDNLIKYNLKDPTEKKLWYGTIEPLVYQYQDNSALYFLTQYKGENNKYEYNRYKYVGRTPIQGSTFDVWGNRWWDYNATATTCTGNGKKEMYVGDANGNVLGGTGSGIYDYGVKAQLPGAISDLSNNGEEVFATSEATNAFFNVTLNGYNIVKDENGQAKPMVPPTKEGLLRVIDNRKKGGKFLYVTRKGVHAIE